MPRPHFTSAIATIALIAATGAASAQSSVSIVTSIPPVHSLAAMVMGELGTPQLLLEGGQSPHTYALKPSDASALQNADIVVWVGPDLEGFLERPLETLAADAKHVALIDAPGLHLMEYRDFEDHGHDEHDEHDEHEHDHEEHDDHDHAHDEHDHDGHGHDDHDHDDHDHDDHDGHDHEGHDHGHEGHDHSGVDSHIWLDPENGKAILNAIAEALANADPDNASAYAANAENATVELDALSAEIAEQLAGLGEKGFFTFHDAYHYFEERFGLESAGVVTLSPELPPSAARVAELRETLEHENVNCMFAEPQFTPRVLQTVAEGTDARIEVLDPLGAGLEPGPDLYPALLSNLATSFSTCLSD